MNDDTIIINSIKRIIFIAADEYKDKTTSFDTGELYNELIFKLSGEYTVKFNGKILSCKPNTLRYMPKGKYSEYIVERDTIGSCIDIVFDANIKLSDEAFTINFSDNTKLSVLFKKAFAVWTGKEDGYYYEVLGITYEILAYIYKKQYTTKSELKKIEPAIQHIAENYLNDDITIPYLASICGISESYLKKLFIKKYGLSPKKYIINLKMNYARDLLNSQMMSVTAIADYLGYGSIYHFSKEFKKHTGLSPTEYTKKWKSSRC